MNFIQSIKQNGTNVKEFDNYVTSGEIWQMMKKW